MAIFTTAAVVGVGLAGFGAYNNYKGGKTQQKAAQQAQILQQQGTGLQLQGAQQQTQIAKEQAALSGEFAGQEYALNLQANAFSVDAANRSFDLSTQMVGKEREIQKQRNVAMELDARRKQMEVIRNQQRARSLGLTVATAQGASRGSGLQGAYGQIAGQSGVNALGIQQNLQIGQNIAGLNEGISGLRTQGAQLENQYALQRAGITTSKANMAYQYALQGAQLQSRYAEAGGLISQGAALLGNAQGTAAYGQAVGGAQQAFGNSMMSLGTSIFGAGQSFGQLSGSIGGYANQGLGYAQYGTNPFTSTGGVNPYYG